MTKDAFCCSLSDLNGMIGLKNLHDSCRDHGYFYIGGFETKELNLQNVFSEAIDFFNLPVTEKLKNKSSPSNQYLGYRGIGTEKSVMTGSPELCEQYKFGYFHDKENNSSTLLLNYFSSYETVFKRYSSLYFNSMEQMAAKILMAIANNFSLGQEYFQPYCDQPTHQLGLNYYPAANPGEQVCQNYAMSAHKDLCLLAIIAQNKEGLMVQNLQGEWKLIPYMPNTLLVLLGDYLERWTNGYYIAPVHCVLESSSDPRISLIYKHRPNYETIIPVIPGINPEKRENDSNAEFHTGKAYEKKINNIMSSNNS